MPCSYRSLAGVIAIASPCVALLRGFDNPAVVPKVDETSKSIGEKCANLVNKGSHSEIEVSVGTPGQVFSVVADTGSNSVIIPSCVCQQHGSCEEKSHCFTGTDKSSTFLLTKAPGGDKGLVEEMITFGSGPLNAVSASDIVNVSGLSHKIDGLLLMVDNNLHMPGFEGIFGMGTPGSELAKQEEEKEMKKEIPMKSAIVRHDGKIGDKDGEEAVRDIIRQIMGGAADTSAASTPSQMLDRDVMTIKPKAAPSNHSKKPGKLEMRPKSQPGFMEQAGVEHFSMCFNEKSDGVLRFGEAPKHHETNAMNSIGKAHWGLGMSGLSIGNETALLDICRNKTEEQDSNCGAIPDSGTTVLMAPHKHIISVFEGICESWDRCKKNFTAYQEASRASSKAAADVYGFDPFGIDKEVSKSFIFQLLLLDCESWMNMDDETHGLNDLPELFFHLGGDKGEGKKLSLSGWSYVLEETNELGNASHEGGLSPSDEHGSLARYLEEDRVAITRARNAFGRFMVGGDKVDPQEGAEQMPPTMGSSDPFGQDGDKFGSHAKELPESIRRLAHRKKICRPAFGEMDYPTQKNGPVWILGTPVFYAYKVGYGLQTKPPTVSFTSVKDSPCGSCGASGAPASLASDVVTPRRPRRVDQPWRMPTLVETGSPL